MSYAYDKLGRVSSRTAVNGSNTLTSSYTFAAGGFDTSTISSTTPLVTKITHNGISFEYAYDELGNIVSEKRGSLTAAFFAGKRHGGFRIPCHSSKHAARNSSTEPSYTASAI